MIEHLDAYRTTDIERLLEEVLAPIGSELAPPVPILEGPPDPDTPIITRTISGSVIGTYHRYLNAASPLQMSIVESVGRLEGYPGTLEEDIFFETPPQMRIMTSFQDGRSMITDVRLEDESEGHHIARLVASWPEPPASSISMLARAYPERFIRTLGLLYARSSLPNAYNTTP